MPVLLCDLRAFVVKNIESIITSCRPIDISILLSEVLLDN